jgi:23S rRNA (cytosine1962-C5)-methyltransferase
MTRSSTLTLLTTPGFSGYALLDSGAGRKLERFGVITVDRPEPQALWQPRLDPADWSKAHAVFSASGEDDEKGKWRVDRPVPESWPVRIDLAHPVTMQCRLSGLWHLGLFPEQLPHWQFMLDRVAAVTGETPRVLNLFGYTGAASLLAAAAGAEVTHVDASKKAVAWGRDNQAASSLQDAKVRWIVDDALKFVARDVRRGKTYHVILVDPPKFGRGPEGETWDLYRHVAPLLADCAKLLAPQQAAMVLTVYAIRASTVAFSQLLQEQLSGRSGTYEIGELAIAEHCGTRVVPTSLFTRWRS